MSPSALHASHRVRPGSVTAACHAQAGGGQGRSRGSQQCMSTWPPSVRVRLFRPLQAPSSPTEPHGEGPSLPVLSVAGPAPSARGAHRQGGVPRAAGSGPGDEGPCWDTPAAGRHELICGRRASQQGASPSCLQMRPSALLPSPLPSAASLPSAGPGCRGRLRPLWCQLSQRPVWWRGKGPGPGHSSAHTASLLVPQATPFKLCPTTRGLGSAALHPGGSGRPALLPEAWGGGHVAGRQGHAGGPVSASGVAARGGVTGQGL